MTEAVYERIRRAFAESRRILLVSHVRPDGDAVGSLLGLGLSLREAGKDVQMVLEDGVPSAFRFLEGAETVVWKPTGAFDCVVAVDSSDLARTGRALAGLGAPTINIDHHPTNENFAEINLVIETACSTTEILTGLLARLDLPFPPGAVDALLTGLITDTIGFQTPNMTAAALQVASGLVARGADISELYRKGLVEKSFEALRYWGAGLQSLEREGDLVWVSLSLSDRKAAGYPGRDDADLIGQLSTIRGSNVRVIFIEQSAEEVKVSWRSQPGFDVAAVASRFGGGGHRTASGATIAGSLAEVRRAVLEMTREMTGAGIPAGVPAEQP